MHNITKPFHNAFMDVFGDMLQNTLYNENTCCIWCKTRVT
jgi:hypothetical protein